MIFSDASLATPKDVISEFLDTKIGIPNLVTSILASYRGYDTLGEVTVIFTAGIGVLMLLGRSRGNYKGIVSREKS